MYVKTDYSKYLVSLQLSKDIITKTKFWTINSTSIAEWGVWYLLILWVCYSRIVRSLATLPVFLCCEDAAGRNLRNYLIHLNHCTSQATEGPEPILKRPWERKERRALLTPSWVQSDWAAALYRTLACRQCPNAEPDYEQRIRVSSQCLWTIPI